MNGSRTRSAAFSAIRCVRKRSRENASWTCKGITTRCVPMLRGYLTRLGCCTGGTIICSSSHGRDRTAGNWRRCSEGYCVGWRMWRRHFTLWCTRRLTRETRRVNCPAIGRRCRTITTGTLKSCRSWRSAASPTASKRCISTRSCRSRRRRTSERWTPIHEFLRFEGRRAGRHHYQPDRAAVFRDFLRGFVPGAASHPSICRGILDHRRPHRQSRRDHRVERRQFLCGSRRARYIFRRVFPQDIEVRVASARDGDFDPQRWWEKRKSVKELMREFAGMMVALWELRGSSEKEEITQGVVGPGGPIPQQVV